MVRALLPGAALCVLSFTPSLLRAESALGAVARIPQDQVAHIAMIEGRSGAPEPGRWYILVQDGTAANGVHEYVVAENAVVASRSISQFAQSLTPDQVIGAAQVKTDSDAAARLAQSYADANGLKVASFNYELKKDGTNGASAWTISCLDEEGEKKAAVTVSAVEGTVVSQEGFNLTPEEKTPAAAAADSPKSKARKETKFDVYAKPEVKGGASASPAPDEEVVVMDASGHRQRRKVRKEDQSSGIGKTFKNVGQTLHKFLPF